jgi:hypothetical protein
MVYMTRRRLPGHNQVADGGREEPCHASSGHSRGPRGGDDAQAGFHGRHQGSKDLGQCHWTAGELFQLTPQLFMLAYNLLTSVGTISYFFPTLMNALGYTGRTAQCESVSTRAERVSDHASSHDGPDLLCRPGDLAVHGLERGQNRPESVSPPRRLRVGSRVLHSLCHGVKHHRPVSPEIRATSPASDRLQLHIHLLWRCRHLDCGPPVPQLDGDHVRWSREARGLHRHHQWPR